jgi:antirestriction protein ArdC
LAAGICEHGIGRLALAFPQPLTQCADYFFAQRDAARFASFTIAAHVSAGFQGHIVERTLDNSAAYIGSWLQRLRSDAHLVVQAAAQAQKAADFVLCKQGQDENQIQPATAG